MSERYHLIKFRQLCAFFRRGLWAKIFFQCLVGLHLTSVHSHPIDSSFLSVLMSLDIGGGGSLNIIARRQGNRSTTALPSPPFFLLSGRAPVLQKAFEYLLLCFPFVTLNTGGGEKIDLSTFATSSLPFYHRHSRLQMCRISPQKPFQGAQ